MPEKPNRAEARALAAWRAHACMAGLCTGVQVFLLGCGVAMPIAMNAAWIAVLPALPVCALIVRRCCAGAWHMPGRGALLLLSLTLLLCAAFAAASLVSFAEQTLVPQAQATWSTAAVLIAAFLCALGGGAGVSRLCFALRWLVPVLLVGLSALSVPARIPIGLFPLLGAGGAPLSGAGLCVLSGCVPALLLLLPPAELSERGMEKMCAPPQTSFFVRRVLAGAAVGALLVFAACAFTTYEAIAGTGEWGARLRIAAAYQPREGLAQMLLTVLELLAMLLLLSAMLCAAEQALCLAWPKMKHARLGLMVLMLMLAASMGLLIIFGFQAAHAAAPFLSVPAAAVLLLAGRRRKPA